MTSQSRNDDLGKQDCQSQPDLKSSRDGGQEDHVIHLLKQDHRKIRTLFGQFFESEDEAAMFHFVQQIAEELVIYCDAKEAVLYPAYQTTLASNVDESRRGQNAILIQLRGILVNDQGKADLLHHMTSLSEAVLRHFETEEYFSEGFFSGILNSDGDFRRLGKQVHQRKELRRGEINRHGLELR